jgi:putative ABC transport system substrate-binding protein
VTIRSCRSSFGRALLVLLVTVDLLAAPGPAGGQSLGKVYRIGILEIVPAASNAVHLDAFRRGLRELGYVEGRNILIEYRSADGRADRFPGFAAELVGLSVDLIVTRGTPAALAAKQATRTIPIVMASSGDPLGVGLVASLARPGANVTGLSALATDIQGKLLEVLREVVPRTVRVAFLFNMANPVMAAQWREVEPTARSLGLQPSLLDARTARQLDAALEFAGRQRPDAVVVGNDALTQANRGRIAEALARYRLPAIAREREFVAAGLLMSYGIHYADSYHRAATYVAKILQGARPADLPVEQSTRFELVINLRTARALGLTIPQSVLARADQMIE